MHELKLVGTAALVALVGSAFALGAPRARPAHAFAGGRPGIGSTIAAGDAHTVVIASNGTTWAFGANNWGQLALPRADAEPVSVPEPDPERGDRNQRFAADGRGPTPTPVGLSNVAAVSAGGSHALALRTDGTVWAFGSNAAGQLGSDTNVGTNAPNPAPSAVPGLTGITAISAGATHSLALRADGTVFAFGSNRDGELGSNINLDSDAPNPTPTPIAGLSKVTAIAAGGRFSVALRTDGTVWTFGSNSFGELGSSDTFGARPTPTPIVNLVGMAEPPAVVTVTPARLADTRPGAATADGTFAGRGRLAAREIWRVQIAGRAEIPVGAPSAGLNLTVVDPADAGYATVFPCDVAVPNASTVNFGAGRTTPNAVVGKLDGAGGVCVMTSVAAHVLIDVDAYIAAEGLTPLVPVRFADTRLPGLTIDAASSGGGPMKRGGVLTVRVAGRGQVPVGAPAAILNVTAVDAGADGYATVYPCDGSRPNTSSLNYQANGTVANLAFAKLDSTGRACVYVSAATQILVDVQGFVPPDVGFVPITPVRLADTRGPGLTIDGEVSGTPDLLYGPLRLQVAGRGGIPQGTTAVALNLTAVAGPWDGYATAYPCDVPIPNTSNLNYRAGQAVANTAVADLDDEGRVCIYVSAFTAIIVDVTAHIP